MYRSILQNYCRKDCRWKKSALRSLQRHFFCNAFTKAVTNLLPKTTNGDGGNNCVVLLFSAGKQHKSWLHAYCRYAVLPPKKLSLATCNNCNNGSTQDTKNS